MNEGADMLIDIMKPDFIHQSETGVLTQLVRSGFRQVNVIESKAGDHRGGHFHKQNQEAFFVVQGAFRLSVSMNEEQETHKFQKGDMFSIPAYVKHSFDFAEDTILVSMYSGGVELADGSMDIYTQ